MLKKKIPNIEGREAILDILCKENGLNISSQEEFDNLFPDISTPNLNNVLELLTPLKMSQFFINEIVSTPLDKRICIIGDYDVDGIMATVIMHTALSILGYNVSFYIPNRLTEGYGMSDECFQDSNVKYADVLITVDNGISCKNVIDDAIKLYNKRVIVTDHHLPTEGQVPTGCLVIDPKYNDDIFPEICGATVALKLTYALYKYLGYQYPFNELFPLAGIATVADMMPVLSENRHIIRTTLDLIDMCKTDTVGLRFLRQIVRSIGGFSFIEREPDAVASEGLISFYIAPTMNAVSRVKGDVTLLVYEILNCLNHGTPITSKMGINIQRKKLTAQMTDAFNDETEYFDGDDSEVVVHTFSKYEFSDDIKGVIGLMANKITDRLHKPALIGVYEYDYDAESAKITSIKSFDYSCRSVIGYDLHAAIDRIKLKYPELNIRGGGHALAMGIKIDGDGTNSKNNEEKLKMALCEDFREFSNISEPSAYIFEKERENEIIDAVSYFSPYGQNLKTPTFVYSGKFTDFNTVTKDAVVGDYVFKLFATDDDLKLLGKDIEVYFNITFENARYSTFRCREIKGV